MKLREMVEWVASATGIPEPTVNETARMLQKADLIKTGRPGRYGGSAMDEDDAAALIIALLAAEGRRGVVDAAQAVREVGRQPLCFFSDHDIEEFPEVCEIFDLPPKHTFFDLVRTAVRHAPDPRLIVGYEITMSFPQRALQVMMHPSVAGGSVGGEYGTRSPQVIIRSEEALTAPAFSVRRAFSDVFFWGLHREMFSGTERTEGGNHA